ncbi:hypothetical protein EON65_55980, partial [archaeon]
MDIAQRFVVRAQSYAKAQTKRDVVSWEAFLKTFKQDNQAKVACLTIIRHFPMQIEGLLAAQALRDMCKKSEMFSIETYQQVLETLSHLLPTHNDISTCLQHTPIHVHPVISQLSIVLSVLLVQRLLTEGKRQSVQDYLSLLPHILEQVVKDTNQLQVAPWFVLEVLSVLPEHKPTRLPGILGRGGV